jgi:ketosteroid isomerase-like protein
MSLRLPVLALLGTVFLGSAAHAATSANEAAILKIEQGMSAAQTAAAFIAHWDPNAVFDDMFAMTPRTSEYVGADAIIKDLDPQFATITNAASHILRIKIVADNKLGFAYSTQHFHADGKDKAPAVDFTFRETDCFVKKGGKWLVVHEQISVPVDPGTNKAIYDTQ